MIVGAAHITGLRRSELRGLLWENYNGPRDRHHALGVGRLRERAEDQKVEGSGAGHPGSGILNAYREQCGNPTSGVMFASSKGTPLSLNNVLNRSILPALRKAGCEWHGWHAFRRGLGTNLYRLGVPDKTIQAILRHANASTTMNICVKSVSADSTAAMKLLETALCANCAPASAPGTAAVVN